MTSVTPETPTKPFDELSTVGKRFPLGQDEKDDYTLRALLADALGRCLWCPDVLFEGTAAEVFSQQEAHRKERHPQAKDRGQRARNVAAREAKRWPR